MVILSHNIIIVSNTDRKVNEYRGKNRKNTKKVHLKRMDL